MKTTYILLMMALVWILQACMEQRQRPDLHTDSIPRTYPNYTGVTFPVNITPPNFIIRGGADVSQTETGVEKVTDILYTSRQPEAIIPSKAWKKLPQKAAGREVFVHIILLKDGRWTCFVDITDTASNEMINPYLVYRLLYPGYELRSEMGIYQQNLTNYEEAPIAENKALEKQCINCHTFNQNSLEAVMIHVRGKSGGTLISKNREIEKVNTEPEGGKNEGAYAAWHPIG